MEANLWKHIWKPVNKNLEFSMTLKKTFPVKNLYNCDCVWILQICMLAFLNKKNWEEIWRWDILNFLIQNKTTTELFDTKVLVFQVLTKQITKKGEVNLEQQVDKQQWWRLLAKFCENKIFQLRPVQNKLRSKMLTTIR